MIRTVAILFAVLAIAAGGLANGATLRGTIHFQGEVPKQAMTPGAKCHENAQDIPQEIILVSKAGGLQNAVVYVEGATAPDSSKATPVILDQKNCRYIPHVVAMQVNQMLTIKTSDATLHNVHYNPDINTPANFGMTEPGQQRVVSFKQPEIFKVSCDVHSWMNAWIAVFDHPFFSVTTDAGTFEIKNIPPGSYKLTCWHERFGKLEKTIDVTDKDFSTDFNYKAPD
jgi:hypothetical protein